MSNYPPQPHSGVGGRWEKLGEVNVDGATIAISDAAFAPAGGRPTFVDKASPWGSGIQFMPGFGDGSYEVWGWVADYGKDDEPDERIGIITLTFITAQDFKNWHADG